MPEARLRHSRAKRDRPALIAGCTIIEPGTIGHMRARLAERSQGRLSRGADRWSPGCGIAVKVGGWARAAGGGKEGDVSETTTAAPRTGGNAPEMTVSELSGAIKRALDPLDIMNPGKIVTLS